MLRTLLTLTLLASTTLTDARMPGEPGSSHTALWLRPPATAEALTRTLVEAKRAGFSDVLLEGFYHGRAAWTSQVAPMKLSYDAVATAAEVARREGLHLNVWFETLYWRPAEQFGIPVTPLWQDRYATRTAAGQASLELSRLGFVDPASPEVGALLEGLVRELGQQYPDVGLHLDYLRYPREADFGYLPAAVDGFQRDTGLDALSLRRTEADGQPSTQWQRWTSYRQQQITRLADRLIGAYHDAGGDGMVSAAVFGASDPLQNWRGWHGLDAAMPMLYYPVLGLYQLARFRFPPSEQVWPGIEVGAGRPALHQQLDYLHRLGYRNVSVFGWTPESRP
ncbi:family 10 glycosylhydrolase [Deinococcus sonorensis]|uniref:Family 10 glycosylhydrolase n=2 Tax=Deinococcus sonorensis TaxID=309891 RepID=A0AAU7UC06_9DEIO